MRYPWSRMRNATKAMFILASLFSLLAQPFLMISVRALTEEAIVINEFSANGDDDWVELYNPSSDSVSIEGWQLRNTITGTKRDLGGTITARGFLVVEFSDNLNATSDTIHLLDSSSVEVATLTYTVDGEIPCPSKGQSTGRSYDGGPTWLSGTPTMGLANDTQAPPVPEGETPYEVAETSVAFLFSWWALSDSDVMSLDIEETFETGEIVTLTASEEEAQTQERMQERDTTQVQDGVNTIRLTGANTGGNESTLARPPRVVNMAASGRGILSKDPLLELLSVSLMQPFTPMLATPFSTSFVRPSAEDARAISREEATASVGLKLPPVAATENGWCFFGILWYWWLLAALLVGGLGVCVRRIMKRRQLTNRHGGI